MVNYFIALINEFKLGLPHFGHLGQLQLIIVRYNAQTIWVNLRFGRYVRCMVQVAKDLHNMKIGVFAGKLLRFL